MAPADNKKKPRTWEIKQARGLRQFACPVELGKRCETITPAQLVDTVDHRVLGPASVKFADSPYRDALERCKLDKRGRPPMRAHSGAGADVDGANEGEITPRHTLMGHNVSTVPCRLT